MTQCVLLGGQSNHKNVHLGNNTKALGILKGNRTIEDSISKADIEINKICVKNKTNFHGILDAAF